MCLKKIENGNAYYSFPYNIKLTKITSTAPIITLIGITVIIF